MKTKQNSGFTQHYLLRDFKKIRSFFNPQKLNFKHKPGNSAGFTLIELLIVIAIIGMLAATITLVMLNARIRSRDAKRAGDIRQLMTSLEQYRIARGVYPVGTNSSSGSGAALHDPLAMDLAAEIFTPTYVPIFPMAPGPQDGSCGAPPGRGANNYWYDVAADGSFYTLTFCLGKDVGDFQAGVRSATPNGVQ